MTIHEMQARLDAFAEERDWRQFHTPKNLILALTAEVGELAELFQWLTPEQANTLMLSGAQADRVREELADVFGYVLRLADVLNIDLEVALHSKIAVNAEKYPINKAFGTAAKYTDLTDRGDA